MKILFIDTVHPFLKQELEKQNHICDTAYAKSKAEIQEIINNYQGIIIRSRFKIDKEFIDCSSNLQFIARAGSGLENIDVEYAESKKIQCYNAPEGNRQAVAEHALGMLLSLFNNLNTADQEVRNGTWERERNRGIELAGKTIGMIGYGNNGSAFSEVLKGFNVKLLVYDKYLKDYPYKSSMESIYKEADIVSLHIPLTEETTYLVNNNFINSFAKNFYLINTARGKCVNTKNLATALENGKIKGACLDVLECEKTSFENLSNGLTTDMQYLIDSKKTILSPHVAGWTTESNVKIAEVLLDKIISDFQQ
ncbi:MAG: hydroxyacid dehydrogenase [Flavobacteriales bacterium]|jgi:D-3-phosphoglycerate dehydrogenase / 2-oxoglutarate reductase|nr:hydroxyacid dehydrogenase [Flavobacteriales bacterium]MBT4881602.1 hydroxyacid dehydrogenase [Flavobacteriales bacterium]MDG1348486.1 NAD(P)-dependent oxidoreductase [Flavobacteriales bacterium]|tara:strand:+ start:1330 stop:2256 length:927 start_codon:yes stop_codon:yes gene_type:complete